MYQVSVVFCVLLLWWWGFFVICLGFFVCFPKNHPPRTPDNQTKSIRQSKGIERTSKLVQMKEDHFYYIHISLVENVAVQRSPDAFCWRKASLWLVNCEKGWRTLCPFEILDSEVLYYPGYWKLGWINIFLCIRCTVQSCLFADFMAAHTSVKNSKNCMEKIKSFKSLSVWHFFLPPLIYPFSWLSWTRLHHLLH